MTAMRWARWTPTLMTCLAFSRKLGASREMAEWPPPPMCAIEQTTRRAARTLAVDGAQRLAEARRKRVAPVLTIFYKD